MPRLPLVPPIRVTPHGAFGFRRKSPKDGACGARGKYPCTHRGVDMAASKGTPVYAPERGYVAVAVFDNVTPGMRGYGPGAVKFVGQSGATHTLAHLDPKWWEETVWQVPGGIFEGFRGQPRMPTDGRWYREGEQIGVVAKDHLHWEVTVDPAKETKVDPLQWVSGRSAAAASSLSGLLLLLVLALAADSRR